MTDEEIVARVKNGETRLFEELVRRHQDAVYGAALRFLRNPAEAEDVAQEVFLRAFRGLGSFRGASMLSTWLHRVTYNLCVDRQRSERRRRRAASPVEDAAELEDGRVDLAGDVLAEEERARVRRVVDSLEEHYRSVVLLMYYEKRSYEEIAAILGVPVKTVETRLYRARKIIRRRLEREERGGRS